MSIRRLFLLLVMFGAIDTILPAAIHAQARYRLEVASEPYIGLHEAIDIQIDYGDSLHTVDLAGEAFTCFNRRYQSGSDALFSIGGHGRPRASRWPR